MTIQSDRDDLDTANQAGDYRTALILAKRLRNALRAGGAKPTGGPVALPDENLDSGARGLALLTDQANRYLVP